MITVTNVGGAAGGEAFLLETEEKNALIDSGFSFSAPDMIKNLKTRLGGKPLDYVLLTHSHYDHASGSAYLRAEWKDVVIAGSIYAAKILEKPSARAVIREMNDNAAALCGVHDHLDRTEELGIDLMLSEGSVIDLGAVKLRTLETPGHTKCSISFDCGQEKLLIASETLGMPVNGIVMPCYMVGYQMTMDSLRKAIACAPEQILIPHLGVIKGRDARQFLQDSLYWHEEMMRRVTHGYRKGKSIGAIKQEFQKLFYAGEIIRLQPEKAFLLNLSYTIPMLIKEVLGVAI